MCGIMGYYCFGEKRPNKTKLTNMFSLLETRGRDASGIACVRDKRLYVHKEAVKSSVLVKGKVWTNLELPKVLIAHTRMKTQGSEKNNKNNHPLFNEAGLCIVHNGMINNDKEIFRSKKREAEVDSLAILQVLSERKDNEDGIKQVFEKLSGSFAFAMIDRVHPDSLILVKKDNPIVLYYSEYEDILYFCSEREIMQESLNIKKLFRNGFAIGEGGYHIYSMENNYALRINHEGVESYKSYQPRKHGWRDEEDKYEHYYGRSRYSDQEFIEIECPDCGELTEVRQGAFWNNCIYCGAQIDSEDIAAYV